METALVINCGSSSLKIAVFDGTLQRVASALAERLGSEEALARVNGTLSVILPSGASHGDALRRIVDSFRQQGILDRTPTVIGHRVVHGGEAFRQASRIDAQVAGAIADCAELAPLHNPVNQLGIEAAAALFPDVPQVAVFDTAFHQTLPERAYLYAIPMRLYEQWGVRRYGFHGTSHSYMASRTAEILGKSLEETSLISAHLGNGCSITAISRGKSVDTSMGLTPLEGLVMGTRSGDVDPGLFDFLKGKGLDAEEVHRILNNESGLLGISGETNDMRHLGELAAQGHRRADLAIKIFCFRLAKYIAAMTASLTELDALVFTGGIGENSAQVRARTVSHLRLLGFAVDDQRNARRGEDGRAIHSDRSRFPILVVPTDEERVIAREALAIARN
ncbi:acetate kinase [Proteobacteria bacterium 005FR1]|nr:acetate kinase [Proteobacteria bacterium 005FR1]